MEPSSDAPMPKDNTSQQPPAMGQNHVNKAIIASLAVVLVALIGITYFFFNKSKAPAGGVMPNPDTDEKMAKDDQPEVVASPLPDVSVNTWESQAQKPVAPATATTYAMKQTYTPDEINVIASKLGAAEKIETTDKAIVGYSGATSSVMMFYPANGKYLYSSAAGLALPAGATLDQSIYSFLNDLGMYDPTIKVSATYMRQDKPGMKYVELHRSWTDVKMPILNALGLANLPEETRLSQLSPTKVMPDDPKDVNIIKTSDNTDTYKRKDDFNTITIGIDEATQKIVYINSNIRVLMPETTTTALISYDDAITKIQNKQHDFFLSSPAGEGKLDIAQVYPGNAAMSEKATIVDAALAYIEQPPAVNQTMLIPHYVVRGYMETKEGYRLKFTATVNAKADPSAFDRFKNIIPGFTVNAQVGDPGQKQDTLRFPTQQAQEDISIYCKPSEGDMNPIYEYNGMRIGYGPRADKDNVYEWWYINRAGQSEDQILANVRLLFENIPTGVDDSLQFREKIEKLMNEIRTSLPNCPVRFTGSSPTVFVYGDPGQKVSVISTASTTYTEPSTGEDKVWDVTVESSNNLDVEGADRSYLYYEYTPIRYSSGVSGWTVKKSQLEGLAAAIGSKLGLTAMETERLAFEFAHAASSVKGEQVTVKPLARTEVDEKLPLSVAPTMTRIERYHFAVASATGEKMATPQLSPIVRSHTMVLELGAVAQ